jgi:hypothetical protein
MEPVDFSGDGGQCMVFGLNTGMSDDELFLGSPRDKAGAKKNTKAGSGTTIIWITGPIRVTVGGPIRVTVGCKSEGTGVEQEAMINAALEV